MPTQKEELSGLAKILSVEPLPIKPALRGRTPVIEHEKWIDALYYYLRRLFGKFTATNILQTIIDGGGGLPIGVWEKAFDFWIKVAPGKAAGTERVLINEDFRGRVLVMGGSSILDPGVSTVYWDQGSNSFIADIVGDTYGLDRTQIGGSTGASTWVVKIRGSDGKLVLEVDTSAEIEYTHIHFFGYATTHKPGPDITF